MTSRLAVVVAFLTDLVATAVLWPRLPEQVPLHWNFTGEADRYGSKWELLALGPGLVLALWVLLEVLRRVDPKLKALPSDAPPAEAGSREFVIAVVIALLAVVHVSAMLQALGASFGGPLVLALGFGGFQLFLGNALPRVRPNFFVGLRTPWTLSSDSVWRRTHRLAGRLVFASGFVSIAFIAAAPISLAFPVTIVLMMAALLPPCAASYFFWRAERHQP
jgi:uncharacterized membrane protein